MVEDLSLLPRREEEPLDWEKRRVWPTPHAASEQMYEQMTREAREGGIYRPVVFCFCVQRNKSVDTQEPIYNLLMVQHAGDSSDNEYGLLQGGIENGETIGGAVVRELEEELGISPEHISGAYFLGTQHVTTNHYKEGFPHRLYFGCLVILEEEATLLPNQKELRRVHPLPLSDTTISSRLNPRTYGLEKKEMFEHWLEKVRQFYF